MNKILKTVLLCSFSLVVFLALRNYRAYASGVQPLVVGVMSGYAPYALLTDEGQLEGFDIDVARLLAQKLNREVKFIDMSLAPLLISLQQNKVDMVLSGLTITPVRKKEMIMIYYQGAPTTAYPLIFWQTIPESIATIQDIKNKFPESIICVEPGSVQEDYLFSVEGLNLRTLDTMANIIMDLKYGKSLAALIDPDIAPTLLASNPELKVLSLELPIEFQSPGCGIALNNNNPELAAQIQALINQMKKDGQLQLLQKKWFINELEGSNE